jgi:molybdopterin converting factor subunit 1
MTVTVRLFAHVRETAGTEAVRLDITGGTVAEIRERLSARYPLLAGLIARSAVAVNGEYAPDDRALGDTDEVALIPPVSGG